MAAFCQRLNWWTWLSGIVFSGALVSQITRACRAALTAGELRAPNGTCSLLAPTSQSQARPGLAPAECVRRRRQGQDFYAACLEYGSALWLRKLPARAMLCLDRAMGADLKGNEEDTRTLANAVRGDVLVHAHTPEGLFIGNPRVHFQHYADRMNEPRREQRRWRAWACWALSRRVLPSLPGDVRHRVREPAVAEIEERLRHHGLPGEDLLWLGELSGRRVRAGVRSSFCWRRRRGYAHCRPNSA